jgi:NAD(P)-dependent dehydrogenase (short-subunit alcohol dehydrogenase family)
MSARLSGRVVTGAGRGLGRGVAFGLARPGATVIGPANIASDFDNLKLADALPGRTVGPNADLRRSADCDAVISAAQGAGGGHILVSNAGLTPTYRRSPSASTPSSACTNTSARFSGVAHWNGAEIYEWYDRSAKVHT